MRVPTLRYLLTGLIVQEETPPFRAAAYRRGAEEGVDLPVEVGEGVPIPV